MKDVKLAISDANEGVKKALSKVFSWAFLAVVQSAFYAQSPGQDPAR